MYQFQFHFLQTLFTYYFIQWVGTPSTYLEYRLQEVYILSRIVMEEMFVN